MDLLRGRGRPAQGAASEVGQPTLSSAAASAADADAGDFPAGPTSRRPQATPDTPSLYGGPWTKPREGQSGPSACEMKVNVVRRVLFESRHAADAAKAMVRKLRAASAEY